MSDLWTEASYDVEAKQRDLTYHRASAALEELWPFLALSRSEAELEHRKALAMEPLQRIASDTGMSLPDLGQLIDHRFELLVVASSACKCGNKNCQCSGDCKCKPGCDCSNCHPASETTASLNREGEASFSPPPSDSEEGGGSKEAKLALQEGENILAETVPQVAGVGTPEKPVEHDGEQPPAPTEPPQQGEAAGQSPEGPDAPGEFSGPPAATSFPETTKPRQMPDGGSPDPMRDAMSTPGGEAAESGEPGEDSDKDPIGDQVDKIAATVRRYNPHLEEATCRRVARRVVKMYVKAAGDDGINYVGPIPKAQPEEDEAGHPGETAAAGMAGRKLVKELPLLEV
jgi:hypothetical protein